MWMKREETELYPSGQSRGWDVDKIFAGIGINVSTAISTW
jgi:hypothetical protein